MIGIIGAIVPLVQIVIGLIKGVERSVPDPKSGPAKLEIVQEILGAIYGAIPEDSREQMTREQWVAFGTALASALVPVLNKHKIAGFGK